MSTFTFEEIGKQFAVDKPYITIYQRREIAIMHGNLIIYENLNQIIEKMKSILDTYDFSNDNTVIRYCNDINTKKFIVIFEEDNTYEQVCINICNVTDINDIINFLEVNYGDYIGFTDEYFD